MSIYIDPIGESLGLKPIREYFPDYNLNPSVPEDSWYSGKLGTLGLKKTDETKQLISESMKGVANTLGLKRSEENKERVAEARRNAPRKPCPHCGLMLQNQHYNMHIKARHA